MDQVLERGRLAASTPIRESGGVAVALRSGRRLVVWAALYGAALTLLAGLIVVVMTASLRLELRPYGFDLPEQGAMHDPLGTHNMDTVRVARMQKTLAVSEFAAR